MADNLAFRKRKKKIRETYKKTGVYTSALTGAKVGHGSAEGSIQRSKRLAREKRERLADDPTGGGMSPGFAAKHQEAQRPFEAGAGIQFEQPQEKEEKQNWLNEKWEEFKRLTSPTAPVADPEKAEAIKQGWGYKAALAATIPLGATMTTGTHVTKQSAAIFRETGKLIANPKSMGLLSKAVLYIAAGLGATAAVLYIIDKTIGSITFAKFQESEVGDPLGPVLYKAARDGNTELVKELVATGEQLYGNVQGEGEKASGILDKITDAIPYVNVRKASLKKISSHKAAWAAWVKLAEIEQEGGTYAEKQARIEQEKKEDLMMWREEERAYQETLLEGRKQADAADKAWWSARDAELRKQRDAEWQRKIEYWEKVRRFQAENQRSQLGFGLLK